MLKCCYAIFWMYGSKNILFMLPLFEKRKSHKFSNSSYPGSRKVLTSAKIIISGQKCCRHLMQESLKKYLCEQFGYDWTKNKEMVKGGSNGPPTYLTSKKSNLCRVQEVFDFGEYTIIKISVSLTLRAPTVFKNLWKNTGNFAVLVYCAAAN